MPLLKAGLSSATLDPRSISGLEGWWDFSDPATLYTDSGTSLVSADGDVIGQANDKSGNSRHFRQTDNTMRGTYQTGEKAGLSVLRLDGVNDYLVNTALASAFDFLHTGGSTVFMVIKVGLVSNPNTYYYLIDNMTLAGSTGARRGYDIYYDDSGGRNDAYVHFIAGTGIVVLNAANNRAPAQTWVTNSIVSDPANATAASRSFIRKNGTDPVNNNANTGTTSGTSATYALTIGAAGGDGGNPCPCDIGEILIYSRALPDADRSAVGNYLLGKWAIV
jgi:hypothetical protein